MNKRAGRNMKRVYELEGQVRSLTKHLLDTQDQLNTIKKENTHLKEVLFTCGEIAVSDWCDPVVGLVDRTLNGFTISEERYKEILATLNQKEKDNG
jgi:hypothetical protein